MRKMRGNGTLGAGGIIPSDSALAPIFTLAPCRLPYMDTEFWLARWRDGQTRFHQERVTPLLPKYWPTLGIPAAARVFVPLCGKSLDIMWLAGQGHAVLGVEISAVAVTQFFAENGLQPQVRESAMGLHYHAGSIEILCGDVFAMDAVTLASCAAAYDRAALIALPAAMRARYVDHVYGQLAADYRGLLLTLDYDQTQMDGPPFAVDDAETQALYRQHSRATLIDRRDILSKDAKLAAQGLTRLDTLVYQLAARQECAE